MIPPSQYSGVVGVAMSEIGTPYQWAGASPGGFDCSGLVMYAYSQMGVSLPHSSYAMWSDGVSVPRTSSSRATSSSSTASGMSASTSAAASSFMPRTPAPSCRSRASTRARMRRATSAHGASRNADESPAAPESLERARPSRAKEVVSVPRKMRPSLHFLLHMRTTWNGSISFGLVNIPVGLAPATASSARQSDVQFKLLHRDCLTPIKQKRWCPFHDVELSADEIVRGWEAAKGQFVPVEDAELEALESYDTSRAIEIKQFVPAGEVDPIYFDRTYYLVPAATEAQRRPYALLIEAMRDSGVVGLGSFVLAGKEKLCLIRPKGHALALETLFLAEDVRSQEEIDEPVEATAVKKEELALAQQIIAGPRRRLRPGLAPQRLPREAARAARGEARRGRARSPGAGDGVAPVVDLMEALRASVAAAQERACEEARTQARGAGK